MALWWGHFDDRLWSSNKYKLKSPVPESASPLVSPVASHWLSPSPSLFPSLSPFLSLALSPVLSPSLCLGLGPGSVPAPGLCLGIARGFSAGCRGERTTWSSSAGTCVLVRYQEPDVSERKWRGHNYYSSKIFTSCECEWLSTVRLPHSFLSHNTSHSNHISDPDEVLHAPLWQHQTKHEEAVMVISDDFIQKKMHELSKCFVSVCLYMCWICSWPSYDNMMFHLRRMSLDVQKCWPHKQHTLQHEINVLRCNVNARWLYLTDSKAKRMHKHRAVLILQTYLKSFQFGSISQSINHRALERISKLVILVSAVWVNMQP